MQERKMEKLWTRVSMPPPREAMYDVQCETKDASGKTRTKVVRALYLDGQFRISGARPVAWREVDRPQRAVSELELFLPEDDPRKPMVIDKDDMIDLRGTLERMPVTKELRAMSELAKQELARRKGVSVEVIRVHAISPNASGVLAGRVMAISENHAAQAVTDRDLVIHDADRLDRKLVPGEEVTIHYDKGMGAVYDGILYDVRIDADPGVLQPDEVAFLRTQILNTLAIARGSNDEIVKASLKFAMREARDVFGWKGDPAVKSLTVRDSVSMKLAEMLDEKARAADGDRPAPRPAPERLDYGDGDTPVMRMR